MKKPCPDRFRVAGGNVTEIIDEIQCELYIDMPFMKLALSALSPKRVNVQLYSMATDGTYIYYNPIRLIDIFKKNGMYLNRAYLHSVLHCLFFPPVD